MAARMMRLFGGSTRTQLLVLGILLIVLGAIGAAAVIALPNERPGSPIDAPAKDKFYRGVALWAIIGLLTLIIAGVLLVGVATTGFPLVEAAKSHMGVFYVALGGLLLLPATVVARMGALLVADGMYDTAFISAFSKETFSSPAGMVALAIGLVVFVIALLVLLTNLRSLAAVSHRPASVRGGANMAVLMALLVVVTLVAMPFVPALKFTYKSGRVGAVGFESYDPTSLTLGSGQLHWLAKGETRSTYGTTSFWLVLTTWFLFLALVMSVVSAVGLALYAANERKMLVFQLALMPLGVAAFAVLAVLTLLGFNGSVGQLAMRNNVHSAVSNVSYGPSFMPVVMVLAIVVVAFGAIYVMYFKGWLQSLMKGEVLADPISEDSLVDPPTGLPPSPLGWPINWEAMTTGHYTVIAVAVIVLLAGTVSGYYVKRAETAGGPVKVGATSSNIDLQNLPEGNQAFYYNDTAIEGADARPIIWLAGGTWFIKRMELHVTWTDEQPRSFATNMPDTFSVLINSTTSETRSATGSNDPGSRVGDIRVSIDFKQYILTSALLGSKLPPGAVEGNINASVACVTAGDQKGKLGLISYPDSGNAFSATLTVYFKYYESGTQG